MVDLVNDFLRKRKRFKPMGWQVFATGLKETNVPEELIGNKDRWNWMHKTPKTPKTPKKVIIPRTKLRKKTSIKNI